MVLLPSAQLALDTLLQRPTRGIPTFWLNIMEHAHMERLAGVPPGEYRRNHEEVYLASQRAAGVCIIDQYIPDNPLSMGSHGYERRGARRHHRRGGDRPRRHRHRLARGGGRAPGAGRVPAPAASRASLRRRRARARDHRREARVQERFGPTMLKSGYAFVRFPGLYYGQYGYANYFMAYALYPEVMERHFSLQADLALLNNRAAARAYRRGRPAAALSPRPRHGRLARHAGATSKSLDRIWFPHFARCHRAAARGRRPADLALRRQPDGDGARACWRWACAASRASSTRTAWTTRRSAG